MPRSGALVFRFLNNNDTGERFVTRYGVARTRLAATMLLNLAGLPLLYTGDEIGAEFEPYDGGAALSWADPHGLREHYARLVALRREHAVLCSERLEMLETSHPESVLAYVRPGEQRADELIVLLNYHPQPVRAALPAQYLGGHGGARGPAVRRRRSRSPPTLRAIDLPGWGARVLRRGTAPRR